MSFWVSENKVPISQTNISIPAENGINYQSGQEIHITIPETIDFVNPMQTYLNMDVRIHNEQMF